MVEILSGGATPTAAVVTTQQQSAVADNQPIEIDSSDDDSPMAPPPPNITANDPPNPSPLTVSKEMGSVRTSATPSTLNLHQATPTSQKPQKILVCEFYKIHKGRRENCE
eukprot:12975160-Ditylum_brightwellii.AAC.1